jgi:hypothetical protein
MRAWIVAALSLTGCLIAAPTASAAFNFTFTGTNPLVVPGQTQTIRVYLTYDGNGPNTLLSPGLLAANWALRVANGGTGSVTVPEPPNPAVAGNQDFATNGGTITPISAVTAPPALFSTLTGFTNLVGLREGGPTASATTSAQPGNIAGGGTPTSLFLGTVNVTGGNSGTVTIQAGFLNTNATNNFLDGTATGFDTSITPGTITLTVAIPEPGSMALVGMAAFGFVGAAWRRRKAARTETPETVA